MTTEQELLRSVQELRLGIADLASALDRDYMKREEIKQQFTSKEAVWKRFVLMLLIVLGALFVSYFGAISTVSACFLDQEPHPGICSIIPGYDESMDENRKIMHEFEEIKRLLNELRSERGAR